MNDRITRVKSLALTNFRGFVGDNLLVNTDADIVFLNGPNGVGKTSLVDALCLVLTGHHYKEREPLISYSEKEGSVTANVDLRSSQETKIGACLRRSGAKTNVEWSGEEWLRERNNLKSLHARASFYYQDILKYLFEEEDAEAYLEDFLLVSDVPVSEIRQACQHGLSLVESFEKSIYPESTLEPESKIEDERDEIAREWEGALQAAADVVSEVLSDFGLEEDIPSRRVTTQNGTLRKDWKAYLVGLVRDYNDYLKIDFAHELTSDLSTVIMLKDLKAIYEKLVSQHDVQKRKRLAPQQKIKAFFATAHDCDIVLSKDEIHKIEHDKKQIETALKKVTEKQQRIERLLKHFEPKTINGQSLRQVLLEVRKSGPEWLDLDEDLAEEVPEAVVNWLKLSIEALDSVEPAVDVRMTEWLQMQTDMRTSLGEHISKLEAKSKQLSCVIEKSKEFLQILNVSPELIERIPKDLGSMIPAAVLAEKLNVVMESSVEKESEALLRKLVDIVERWLQLEKRSEEVERSKTTDKVYQAVKGDLDELKRILETEAGARTSVTRNLQLITPEKRKSFAERIDNILDRLHVDSGFFPIELGTIGRRGAWKLSTADKRSLNCLSSGQRSLLGIASLIALNTALRTSLWADVLAFDDFTSSLDLNQIPRLASLLRQIAYGSGVSEKAEDQVYKRQIFLVSHHEDLTNKLLDFLIPPPGRTMRVINFTGWSSSGPKFEELDIVPSSSSVQDVKDSLPRLLTEELTRFYERVR